jgi:hypothetical protein
MQDSSMLPIPPYSLCQSDDCTRGEAAAGVAGRRQSRIHGRLGPVHPFIGNRQQRLGFLSIDRVSRRTNGHGQHRLAHDDLAGFPREMMQLRDLFIEPECRPSRE